MADRIGTEIAGYRIVSLLARGGMGEVYLATQAFPERKVALKLLPHELASDPAFRERFIRESNAAASVEHPSIVPVYGAGEDDGELWIAMRYVEGEDLRSLLDREGVLPPERAAAICAQVADALAEAHGHGLVHRDVKPGNILIAPGDRAYLSDFGLIRRTKLETDLTKTGQFMGTVDYVAPEQIRGEPVDGRADVYSLGCVLYECLTGEPPFARETEVATLYAHLEDALSIPLPKESAVPAALDEVVRRSIAKTPEERYGTAHEFSAALRTWSGTIPGRVPPDRSSVSRRKAWLAAGAVLLLTASVTVAVWTTRENAPAPKTAAGSPAAVAKIGRASGGVTSTAHDRHWGWYMVAAEGALWQTGPEGLVKRDGMTGEFEKIFELDGETHTVAAGFGSIWVTVVPAPDQTTLVRIAPATDEVVDNIDVDPSSGGTSGIVSVAQGRDAMWVFNGNGDLWKIDPLSNEIVATNKVVRVGGGIAIGAGAVWVSDVVRDEVVQVDESDAEALARIAMTDKPGWLAFVGGHVWVQNFRAGTITSIDAHTLRVERSIVAPEGQANLAAGLLGLWVAADGVVASIDTITGNSLEIPIGFPASSVAVDERTGSVWALRRPVVWGIGP